MKNIYYGYYDIGYNEQSGEVIIHPISELFSHISDTIKKFKTEVRRPLDDELERYDNLLYHVWIVSNASIPKKMEILYTQFPSPKHLCVFSEWKMIYNQLKDLVDKPLKLKRIIVEDVY